MKSLGRIFGSLTVALVLSFAALGTGCGRPFEVATPEGFVELTEGKNRYDQAHHEYRASTADGVVVGVRAYENEPKVDLALAIRAFENRVRLGEGYALLEKKETTARNGQKGTMLSFGHDEAGGAHLYTVAIFVTEDWVYILEAGGKKDLVDKAKASVDWFIKNFQPE
jgi:hypothetical protein